MRTTRANQGLNLANGTHGLSHSHESLVVPALLVLVASLATGCGTELEGSAATWEPQTEAQSLEVANGLSVNGLSVNGLSVNGLSVNGLSVNGLSADSFQNWFLADPTQGDNVMHYVVLCAAPAGQVLTYAEPGTGKVYSWTGSLGLAPGWASGLPATAAEQQVVSACLAAHVNKYGVHVSISVLGRNGSGQPIPYTASELSTYSRKEACVFGNLFSGQGIYVGNAGLALTQTQSTARACTLADASGSTRTDCAPLVEVGSCDSFCTLDDSGTYYTSCTYQGVTYQPITTRLRTQDIYECGDGICQFTESCGSSSKYDSCQADCGSCN